MKRRLSTLFILVLIPGLLIGQKKPLSHSDYDAWQSLSNYAVSDDGSWVKYEINPQEGDGTLFLYNYKKEKNYSYERGYNSAFSAENDFFVFSVKPEYAETRKAKRAKKKSELMPKDRLGVVLLSDGSSEYFDRVKSYALAPDGGTWMAYHLEKSPEKKDGERKEKEEKNDNGAGKKKGEGTELVIYNPPAKTEYRYEDVSDYRISDNGSVIAYITVMVDTGKVKHSTLNLFNTDNEKSEIVFDADGEIKNLTLSADGLHHSFIFSSDTGDVKVYDLYLGGSGETSMIVNSSTKGMPGEWSVSENGSLAFSENGQSLFFNTAEIPVDEPEDTLLDDEKYCLDIWSWHDPLLQPMQKVNLSRDKKASYMAVYHINEGRMVQLASKDIPSVRLFMKKDGKTAVGSSNLRYRKLLSWESNRYTDYYTIDVTTGETNLILEAAPSVVRFSPSAQRVIFWDIDTKSWKTKAIDSDEVIDLTADTGLAFYNELHDSPSEPSPYTYAPEWIEGERYVLINDRFDIWKLDVTGKDAPVNITNGYGRANNIRFTYTSLEANSRFRPYGGNTDKLYIEPGEKIYLNSFNIYTKDAGLYSVKLNRVADPVKVEEGPYTYSFVKAKEADRLIFTAGNFSHSPELYVCKMNMKDAVKITDTYSQQDKFIWGTNEIVEWRSFDGNTLQGLFYKPENFDPSKKYPMIVYFYERSSDDLNEFNRPAPSASIINRTYAVSNGYLLFIPDIPYTEGYPGQSAYDAVVSGTKAMIDRYDFIDPDMIGLDGQSWGGYQIAYLITQTDMFRCAFSGAPVSNMTSAYGGIRWGSGMSRMYQYEKTQSRIGGTLWDRPIQYIENSPIFFVPKITTPVLIMHNDKDGAVPWYQGIEFFVALRRLGKPAWLLSYNDEDHNLRRRANRKDLSVRKMQFFDHYLKNEAPPYWMEKGISQLEKGTIDGYDLVEKE